MKTLLKFTIRCLVEDGQIDIDKQAFIYKQLENPQEFNRLLRMFWCKKESLGVRRLICAKLKTRHLEQTFFDNLQDLGFNIYFTRSRKYLKPYLDKLYPEFFFLAKSYGL